MSQRPTLDEPTDQGATTVISDSCLAKPSAPDFLIIGAQKSGTSALFSFIASHPGVASPRKKELHFFDNFGEFNGGLDRYLSYFSATELGPSQPRRITGEGSPYYLFHPQVPRRVHTHFPGIKLIAILRNPVDRAYSQYQMSVRKGYEKLSFEEAVAAEPERIQAEIERMRLDEEYDSDVVKHHSYLARGIYVDQLERWGDLFPREQLLILNMEHLILDPAATLAEVNAFLGLPAWLPEETRIVRASRYPKQNPATRERLNAFFTQHNRRLYDYAGRDFGWP